MINCLKRLVGGSALGEWVQLNQLGQKPVQHGHLRDITHCTLPARARGQGHRARSRVSAETLLQTKSNIADCVAAKECSELLERKAKLAKKAKKVS